jgi:(p)ppGpp synthase/HD superfamily hydrolase
MIKFADKVLEFATKAHEGQKRDYTGAPYIVHPIAVANILVKKGKKKIIFDDLDKEIVLSAGYLHDILEDTKVTEQELLSFLAKVVKEGGGTGFTVRVIMDAVMLVTKNKIDFDLFDYLDEIKTSALATELKLADIEHNMSDLKDKKRLEKYKLIKYYLEH